MIATNPSQLHEQPPYPERTQFPPGSWPSPGRERISPFSCLSEDADVQETNRLVIEADRKAILLRETSARIPWPKEWRQRSILCGSIDILVNNATFQRTSEIFDEIPNDEFE